MNGKMLIFILTIAAISVYGEVKDIGNQRQLFVDDYIIERLEGADLKLHTPVNQGTALKMGDTAIETAHSGQFATVIFDQAANKFMMYYRGLYSGAPDEFGTYCYAESKDGIEWVKPDLQIFEIEGSKNNNAILAGPEGTHSFSPFLDTNPDAKKNERFKATGLRRRADDKEWLLIAYASPDGLHWNKMQEKEIMTGNGFDSQNVAFWSQTENCYVCYYRANVKDPAYKYCIGGHRRIARSTSSDFLNWTNGIPMEYLTGGKPSVMEALYTNQTQPYFRAPQIYIGTAARFFQTRKAVDDSLMDENELAKLSGGKKTKGGFYNQNDVKRAFNDCSDAVLIATRAGSNAYSRDFMEAWIKPEIGLDNWVTRTNYPCYGIVQTSPYEMSVYVLCGYGMKTARIVRYSMRLDGFVSVSAPYGCGSLCTQSLRFDGRQLEINYATSAGGFIKVEIQDDNGKAIQNFTADDSQEIIGNHIARIVKWKDNSDVSALTGKTVRLKFVMKDADLFSFKFN